MAPGVVVVIEVERAGGSQAVVGQVLSQSVSGDGALEGRGVILGIVGADGAPDRVDGLSFRQAPLAPAPLALLEAIQDRAGAGMSIGSWHTGGVDALAKLKAGGFNRHTFLCGQSGSGKTYALGVILEQIMLQTSLRMIVFDPNADFARIGEIRPGTAPEDAERLRRIPVSILRPDAGGGTPLRMRFRSLPSAAQAALLQLDPLADRGEYNLFLHLGEATASGIDALVARLLQGGDDDRAFAQRIENLGFPQWEVWAGDHDDANDVIDAGSRVTVLDLGGFRDPREPLAVSLSVIEHLWANRERRTPTLIVIDEAHNLCSAEPGNALQAALTNRLIQIAAEGRKYGLWLLLSTQRPSKIHPQVLSQCDNLALMRMNSPGDILELGNAFGFAPADLLRASSSFTQGEALMAGGFVPVPSVVQMGARLTYEGGSDVRVPLPAP